MASRVWLNRRVPLAGPYVRSTMSCQVDGDERVGATLKRAYAEAQSWIGDQRAEGTSPQ
jgi:hypothetical protein